MRAFGFFFGLILAGLAAIAVFAYPAWALLHPHFDFPFHRVASRIGMLALLIGFVLVSRRLGVADRTSLGYGGPRRQFLRDLGVALAIGVITMLLPIAVMAALGLREWKETLPSGAAEFAALGLEGLLRGLAVALIEETFLRGAMFTAIARESGARLAIVLTAIVYSATHFLARVRIPADEVTWSSGLDMLSRSLAAFADPLSIADAFLCLFAVGVVLGIVRNLTGNIAACIGLHAGWVWVITFVRETSAPIEGHRLAFLLSDFDGVVGWLVLAWTIVLGLLLTSRYVAPALRQTAR